MGGRGGLTEGQGGGCEGAAGAKHLLLWWQPAGRTRKLWAQFSSLLAAVTDGVN